MIDPAKLYELSLTVGTSIRLDTNCDRFLSALIRLKELDHAAVWLQHRLLAGEDSSYGEGSQSSLVRAAIRPASDRTGPPMPLDHPLMQMLERQDSITLSLPDSRLKGALGAPFEGSGHAAVYRLGNLGFLLLHSATRRRSFSRVEVMELDEVVATFARSLEGCIAHHQLAREGAARRRLQAELAHREAHFRALIENALDVILLVGYDNTLTFASPSVRHALGIEPEHLVGRSLLERVHPEQVMQVFQIFRRVADTPGPGPPFEIRLKHGDQSWRTFAASTNNLLADVAVNAVILNLHDVTERNEIREALRRSEERFALAVQGSSDGIWDWDLQLDQVYFSRRWAELVGVAEMGSSPSEWFDRVHPDDLPGLRAAVDAHLRGRSEQLEHEYRIRHADGSWRWALTRGVAIHDHQGRPTRIAGSQSDVTDRVQQTEELDRARQQALAASRARGEFLANMSHELRTPMNGVIGMSSLLLDSPLTPEQQEFVSIVRSSGQALLAIVNDVLDLSKIESGKLQILDEPFGVVECVEHAVDIVAPSVVHKGIHLVYWIDSTAPEVFRGDVVRTRQVLVNVLSNAVKFTEEGEVEVTVAGRDLEDGRCELIFEIRDTGLGISAERIEQLFEPFTQADASTTRRFGGTGLGLAICRRLCRQMGGQISATSEPGAGATFRFTIVGAREPGEPSEPVAPELASAMLVVVHGNEAVGGALVRSAEQWGLEVEMTADPEVAARLVRRSRRPAAVLLDLASTDVELTELLADLAGIHGKQPTGVVLVKPLGSPRTEIRDIPADLRVAWVNSPIKPRRLQRALERVLLDEPVEPPIAALGEPLTTAVGEVRESPLRILLVEDNQVNRRMMTIMLERLGCHAEVARTGVEAVEACARETFDVVLMDVQMPEMDGFEATRRIRELGIDPQPSIIAVTAHAMAGDRERCLANGMDDYLPKPIQLHELRAALRRAGERSGATPALAGADPIDPDRIDKLREIGTSDLLLQMISIFLEESPSQLSILEQAFEDGDARALAETAHALKGSALALGAAPVAGLCQELETLAESARLEDAARPLEQLRAELGRTRNALSSLAGAD